jgi:alcohol dehydrogenase
MINVTRQLFNIEDLYSSSNTKLPTLKTTNMETLVSTNTGNHVIENLNSQKNMKALVYHGPGKKSWEEKPKPVIIKQTDAVLRILKTTICGTDLHIMKGDVPEVVDGTIIGHEGVGIIEEVGSAVTSFKKGDHVLISCITSCGRCDYCKRGMYSHCADGGWVLGHLIDGTQAEYVRIPHAENSLHHIPGGVDEEALVMLSDILPTGFECGVLNGQVKPGDTIAIVGSGPIGLAALLTAQFYSPAEIIMIDPDDNRLEIARTFGATKTINNSKVDVSKEIARLTNGRGVDVAIEAVGIPETFELCTEIIGPGGRVANVGVHGKSATLHLETLWSKNITITTQLVDTVTTPMLMKTVQSRRLTPGKLITHHYQLDQIMDAYQTFENAAKEKALKVILTNTNVTNGD